MGRFGSFVQRALKKKPDGLNDAMVENLCRNYGSRWHDVLASADKKKHLLPICGQYPDIGAQILHAIRKEMAVHLDDVLFRRTGLCTLGNPGIETIEKVADTMASELKWKKKRKNEEIDKIMDGFTVRAD